MVSLALPTRLECTPVPDVSPESFALLNYLRFVALECRAKPKSDLFEACALLHGDRTASCAAHAEALMRCLNDTLGTRARLFSPGTTELSFDERWLISLGRAINNNENASVDFLLKSRVKPDDRRLICFLIGRVSNYFPLI